MGRTDRTGRYRAAAGALVVLLVSGLVTAVASAGQVATPLPNPRQDQIARAQIFDGGVTDKSVYDGRVAFTWGATSLNQPAEVLPSRYVTIDQDAGDIRDSACCGASETLEWFQTNHPDWVVYRCDRATPASNSPLVALDVTNPAVRVFYLEKYINPAISDGWATIAFDHVNAMNYFGRAGHYDARGDWVQMYGPDQQCTTPPSNGSGPGLDDPAWQADQLAWLQFLANYLHGAGVSVAANINTPYWPNQAQADARADLVASVDIWIDEKGYITATSPLQRTGEPWSDKFTFYRQVVDSTCVVSVNRTAASFLANASQQQVNYAIANYLLYRGQCTMLALTGKSQYGQFADRAELDFGIGTAIEPPEQDPSGVWVRQYSAGVTIVNQSPSQAATFTLSAGMWQDAYGNVYSGQVSVPAATGLILRML